jgi:hypothetical protein
MSILKGRLMPLGLPGIGGMAVPLEIEEEIKF